MSVMIRISAPKSHSVVVRNLGILLSSHDWVAKTIGVLGRVAQLGEANAGGASSHHDDLPLGEVLTGFGWGVHHVRPQMT